LHRYRGHDTENPRRIFISGQKRGVFGAITRELRRRSAVGHNFRRVLAWLRVLLRSFLIEILRILISRSALNPAC
jgi:transposase, IS5 family